jgi:hypothetical protein
LTFGKVSIQFVSKRSTALIRVLVAAALAGLTVGCPGMRAIVRRAGPTAERQTQAWHKEINRLGQSGDWLVIRGYHSSDHLVAVASNAEFSHAAILDRDRDEIIEAVSPEVRSVALDGFLSGADRVVLIRPPQASAELGLRAMARARTQIGAPYDFLGTVGLPDPGRFYCSELAIWSTGCEVDVEGTGRIIAPADMLQMGTVLFDSKSRTD